MKLEVHPASALVGAAALGLALIATSQTRTFTEIESRLAIRVDGVPAPD